MEGSDGSRFGQFLTDGEEYHPNQAIMKNPVAPKCSRPIRLLDSSAQKGFIFRIHFLYGSFFGESGLVGKGVVIRIVRFLVQTPPGTQLHLVIQPCYEAPSDLWVKIEKNE